MSPCLVILSALLLGQVGGNLPPPLRPAAPGPVIEEAAPPVVVHGKRADEMTDEELQEFLQSKVESVHHDDGRVMLVRVAPGYPLTLNFSEPFQAVVVGDPALLKVDKIGRNLVLTAQEREGDTSVQVFFAGNKLRVYHVLIAPNFLLGQTAVRVASFESVDPAPHFGLATGTSALDIRLLARVIANYDALVQEKSLDPQLVKRTPIFRTNPRTGFTVYDAYRFSSGMLVLSFAYRNPYDHPIRYDESRLRLVFSHQEYLPDYTSFHQTSLAVGQSTSGFTVLRQSGLRLDQPWELSWK